MAQPYLSIEHIDKSFTRNGLTSTVLRDVNLKIERGEYISIIGHSGCGKSTVLSIVAGLIEPTSGSILLENREVRGPGPERSLVFQNHSLLPWLTVYENVALAVDKVFKGTKSKAERHAWTLHNLEMVNMGHALHKRPREISGGMKQRVGIARAVVHRPALLLADEPTGNLDPRLASEIMGVFEDINSLGTTVLIASHDHALIARLHHRMLTLQRGRLIGDEEESQP